MPVDVDFLASAGFSYALWIVNPLQNFSRLYGFKKYEKLCLIIAKYYVSLHIKCT